MTTPTIIAFLASALEFTTMYGVLLLLDHKNHLYPFDLSIYIAGGSAATALLNYIDVPFHFIFLFMVHLGILHLLTMQRIRDLIVDIIVSSAIITGVQFVLTLLASAVGIRIMDNYFVLFGLLICFVAVVCLIHTRTTFPDQVHAFYPRNRSTILLSSFNILFMVVIVIHIWNNSNDLFLKDRWYLFALVGINYMLNIALFVVFMRKKRITTEALAQKRYGEYLSVIGAQLRRRQHEYKNQIHTLIGLAETTPAERCAEVVSAYGQKIIEDNKRSNEPFDVCSDAMIAAVIYGKEQEARKQSVFFQYTISSDLSAFPVEGYDVAELLNNLLNNAFEAVAVLPAEERDVSLSISDQKIEVLNRIPSDLNTKKISELERDGRSTKGQGRGHGISNVKAIAVKHNGSARFYTMEDVFIAEVLF